MNLVIGSLFFIFIVYLCFRFIQAMVKLKGTVHFPSTLEENAALRKHPERIIDYPSYSNQKVGIIIYSLILFFAVTLYLVGLYLDFEWYFYVFILLPLLNGREFIHLFAVVDGGLLSDNRFISWKQVKSYQIRRIDINHKFYGYSKEANDRYEVKIKTWGSPVTVIVTDDEVKDKLIHILNENGVQEAE